MEPAPTRATSGQPSHPNATLTPTRDQTPDDGKDDHARERFGLAAYAAKEGLALVAIDNGPGSVPIEGTRLPERCVLLFGQEGPGLTPEARTAAAVTVSIAQLGSTGAINGRVPGGIAMHGWVRQHAVVRLPP